LPNLEPMLCIVPSKQTALSGSGVSRYANGASCIFVIPEDLHNLELLSYVVPLKQIPLCSSRKWKPTYLNNPISLKRSRLPAPYYSNSVATNRIILHNGDIKVNPGPDTSNSIVGNINHPRKSSSMKCVKCLSHEMPVQKNQKPCICIIMQRPIPCKMYRCSIKRQEQTSLMSRPAHTVCLFSFLFQSVVKVISLHCMLTTIRPVNRVLGLAASRLQMIATSAFNLLCQRLVN